jgi:hypothetical protein
VNSQQQEVNFKTVRHAQRTVGLANLHMSMISQAAHKRVAATGNKEASSGCMLPCMYAARHQLLDTLLQTS